MEIEFCRSRVTRMTRHIDRSIRYSTLRIPSRRKRALYSRGMNVALHRHWPICFQNISLLGSNFTWKRIPVLRFPRISYQPANIIDVLFFLLFPPSSFLSWKFYWIIDQGGREYLWNCTFYSLYGTIMKFAVVSERFEE